MPAYRLRKRVVSRLLGDLRSATELGLAFLLTAGVAGCGGKAETGGDAGGVKDAGHDSGNCLQCFEAAQFEGGVIEAAQIEGGAIEAAYPEGGFVEAAQVEGGVTEGAKQVDAG